MAHPAGQMRNVGGGSIALISMRPLRTESFPTESTLPDVYSYTCVACVGFTPPATHVTWFLRVRMTRLPFSVYASAAM